MVLVGSGADEPHAGSQVEWVDKEKRWVSSSGDAIVAEMAALFEDRMHLDGTFHCLDCRKSRRMPHFRATLVGDSYI